MEGSGSKWAPESGGVTADVSSIKRGSCDIIEEGVGWLGCLDGLLRAVVDRCAAANAEETVAAMLGDGPSRTGPLWP